MSAVDTSAPAPLRLPAILQNPVNTSQRQVEAYNVQQREKLQARREAKSIPKIEGKFNGKGKRVIRRLDNAQFTSNPYIQQPLKSDYYPSVPLQSRPLNSITTPSFSDNTLSRKELIPSSILPEKNSGSNDSINGNFNLSLKGVRSLLRKRGNNSGRRVEILVNKVESNLRNWLIGDNNNDFLSYQQEVNDHGLNWKIIDDTPIELSSVTSTESNSSSNSSGSSSQHTNSSRRLPPQHQITGLLPGLPKSKDNNQLSSILEISRSPIHLSWYIVDNFDRLVVHLLARYYELLSWSEQYQTISGESIRLTHITKPTIIKPRIPSNTNHLMTPETSELSSQSGPESAGALTSASSSSASSSDNEDDSDTATEKGEDDHDNDHEGYSLEGVGDETITSLPQAMSNLSIRNAEVEEATIPLQRTISNLSTTSSAYASSEASNNSDYSLLNDSFILPTQSQSVKPIDEWSDFGSDLGDLPLPSNRNLISQTRSNQVAFGSISSNGQVNGIRKSWEDKPTFFEYLYGA